MLEKLLLLNKPLVVKTVNNLIAYGLANEASDIHLDFSQGGLNVCYRVGGQLGSILTVPAHLATAVKHRLERLAKINRDGNGAFAIKTTAAQTNLTVNKFKVTGGEKIIIKLRPATLTVPAAEELGLTADQWTLIKEGLTTPGLILLTGPAGSGKTATAYALLEAINTPRLNICTIEETVEKNIPRLNQLQINNRRGLNWAAAFKTLASQDADVIYLSALPAAHLNETAKLSSGKLLLAPLDVAAINDTLNFCAGSSLAGQVKLIINQRLARRLCPACLTAYSITPALLDELNEKFDLLGEDLAGLELYRGSGCRRCNHSGYQGLVGLFEVLKISAPLSEALLKKNLTVARELAAEQLDLSLVESGFIAALNGLTSVEELIRVI